ncbi:MAG: class I SAM-dependent methyltransferase [Thermocrispum sp.]
MSAHVDAARAASARQAATPLASAEVGDARELPAEDGTVDVVLLLGLGPPYHLVKAEERAHALGAPHRVLRPGGRMFAASMSHFRVDARRAARRDDHKPGLRGDG